MLNVEKFLISLRNNKDLDGKLNPIFLANTVQEEIKIIRAAVENSRRGWVGLTEREAWDAIDEMREGGLLDVARAVEDKLKEKNYI